MKPESYAILVDGSFFVHRMKAAKVPTNGETFKQFVEDVTEHEALKGLWLYRSFFYHSHPLRLRVEKPLCGGEVDFGKQPIVAWSDHLHKDINRLPFTSLRLGELRFRGWMIHRDNLPMEEENVDIAQDKLYPNIQPKGIDIRLGIDLATLVLKDQVGAIVLVAGDADYLPAMRFARQEGLHIYLVPLGAHMPDAMIEQADMLLDVRQPQATAESS